MSFSIPKFNMKFGFPPFFLKLFPPFWYAYPKIFSGYPHFEIFKIWFPPFERGEGHTMNSMLIWGISRNEYFFKHLKYIWKFLLNAHFRNVFELCISKKRFLRAHRMSIIYTFAIQDISFITASIILRNDSQGILYTYLYATSSLLIDRDLVKGSLSWI